MEERLQKIIANKGLCSRREAEKWIEEGRVKVNGQIATIGQKVDIETQDVVVNGKSIKNLNPSKYVIAINKPRGYTCSNEDSYAEKLVFELLPKQFLRMKLFIAGRLDKESSGLVIVTNDGAFAQRLTHPSHEIEKRYRVKFRGTLERKDFPWFLEGRRVDGEILKFEKMIAPYRESEPFKEVDVILSHGKKREIRRLFQRSGREVQRLNRMSIGRFQATVVPVGGYKVLSEKEIESLLATPRERN